MPRSRFSTLIKKYNVNQKPLTFPLRFGPKEFNTTIKKLLKDDNIETNNVNFNFFINGERLTSSLDEFIENNNISQEIEEITYDIEMQPPALEGEVKTKDVITTISSRSKWLLTASYDIQIFDVNTLDKPVIFIEMKDDMFTAEWISLDESKQEAVIIVGGQFGQISLWRVNMNDGSASEICKFIGPKQETSCFAVNSELGLVASGTKDGSLCVWSTDLKDLIDNVHKGVKIPSRFPLLTETAHTQWITEIKWLSKPIEPVSAARSHNDCSTTGNLVTCSRDFYLKLWHVTDSQCSLVREENTTNPIRSIDCNSDSGLIIVGSDNNRLKIYDLSRQDPQIHNLFKAHEHSITSVKWSQGNPNTFVTAGARGALKMWDIRNVTVPLLVIAKHCSSIIDMDLSEDGRRLACSTRDSKLRLYKFEL